MTRKKRTSKQQDKSIEKRNAVKKKTKKKWKVLKVKVHVFRQKGLASEISQFKSNLIFYCVHITFFFKYHALGIVFIFTLHPSSQTSFNYFVQKRKG